MALKKKKTAAKWMQGAVPPSHKGLLHEKLGIPQDEKIPKALIRKKISQLQAEAAGDKKLPASKSKLLKELLFARTASAIKKPKKKSLMRG
jgi:hypothetical protein